MQKRWRHGRTLRLWRAMNGFAGSSRPKRQKQELAGSNGAVPASKRESGDPVVGLAVRIVEIKANIRLLELENRCTGNRTVGSNPTLSANVADNFMILLLNILARLTSQQTYQLMLKPKLSPKGGQGRVEAGLPYFPDPQTKRPALGLLWA